jgi:hypothetical protein
MTHYSGFSGDCERQTAGLTSAVLIWEKLCVTTFPAAGLPIPTKDLKLLLRGLRCC